MSSSQRRSSPTDSGEGQYAEVVQPGVPVTPRQYSGLPTPNHPEDSRLLASPSVATGFAHQQEQLLTSQEYIEVNRGGVVGRSGSAGSFVPTNASPLGANSRHTPAPNPNSASYPSSTSSSVSASNPFVGGGAPLPRSVTGSGSRPASRGSFRVVSNSSHGFASAHSNHELSSDGVITTLGLGSGPHTSAFPPSLGTHGSMVLYRLADSTSGSTKSAKSASGSEPLLLPPRMFSNRNSVASSSGDSIMSLADSKYPSGPGGMGDRGLGVGGSVRGLIPYAYDPFQDDGDADEEDYLHDPNAGLKNPQQRSPRYDKDGQSTPTPSKKKIVPIGPDGKPYHAPKSFPWRGVVNFSVLIFLVLALLSLFLLYPLLTFFRDEKRNEAIEGNIRINATGQAAVLFQMPELVDPETPDSAKSRTGFDGFDYELVFSDEFNKPGRTFYPGDDPFWEAVDLWYGSTQDLEWYDPLQVTTRDGALVITMDSTSTTQAGVTPNSTAPFTEADNHGLDYRSGMLQSWNKFCFTTGYIEVSVTFPGPDQSTQGYWPGAWTMGNLGRPGYLGSTDGMWPYTYDSCDVGTFPNQTYKDGSGPAAALHSDKSRSTNNFELSWLSGQRVSACTCPGGDHPGPSVNKGRGAPEIDIFETEKDKNIPIVQVVSQSSQFGPFAHDYQAFNDTGDWTNFNTTTTRGNTFHGSAVQQSISALTVLPEDMFQGSGAVYHTLGFEYWSDPNNRQDGVITWQVDGQKTHQVTAAAVGPDPLPNGSGVSQRLISEEPMSIVLNLGISKNWQTIDLTTMIFPAELKFDYVRVYQRKGQQNYGCSPPNYPTSDYINNHPQAYFDVNATAWPYEKPKNSMYDGC